MTFSNGGGGGGWGGGGVGRRGERGEKFITLSVSVKHKKDKKLFLHIDITYCFTKAIKRVFKHCLCCLFVCCTYNQAFSFNRKRLD